MLVSGLFFPLLITLALGLTYDVEREFKKKFGADVIDPACGPLVYHDDTCLFNKTFNEVSGQLIYNINRPREKRNAIKCHHWLWPKGLVPFHLKLSNPTILAKLHEALLEFNAITPCLQFIPVGPASLHYHNRVLEVSESQPFIGTRCRASVGTTVANPYMKLSTACSKGSILHEMMHVVGFSHEHTRPDRDRYVEIRCENIYPNVTIDFRKLRRSAIETFGEPYDFASLMHYSFDHFSTNGRPTIVPLVPVPEGLNVGHADTFSPSDIRRIRKLYRCQ